MMTRYLDLAKAFDALISPVQHIVIIQADNPDADSLASSLALEALLLDRGKRVTMYCSLDIPEYLRYMPGWDRITKDLPHQFDRAILVDCGFRSLLLNLEKTYGLHTLPSQKLIILDHHDASEHDIDAALDINDADAVATGQVIYELASALAWSIPLDAAGFISQSILADTLGLTSEAVTGQPRPFEIMAELVRAGVNLADWQERRLEKSKLTPEVFSYRISLLERIEFYENHQIAVLTIPYEELKEHSQNYNPTIALDEARLVEGVRLMIGFKQYISNGRLVRVTGRIRATGSALIADKLAAEFGDGGGHPYAAGFKIESDNVNFEKLKSDIIARAVQLLQVNDSQ